MDNEEIIVACCGALKEAIMNQLRGPNGRRGQIIYEKVDNGYVIKQGDLRPEVYGWKIGEVFYSNRGIMLRVTGKDAHRNGLDLVLKAVEEDFQGDIGPHVSKLRKLALSNGNINIYGEFERRY